MPVFDELYKTHASAPGQTQPVKQDQQAPQIDPQRIMSDFRTWRQNFRGDPGAELQKLMDAGQVPAPLMRIYQMFARYYAGGGR